MEYMTLPARASTAVQGCVALIALCLVLGVAGCGGGADVPETAPASGVVLYQGEPVDEAEVAFHPEGEGHPAIGRTDAEGRFVLTTYSSADGAVPGKHTVTVQVMPEGALPGMETEAAGAAAIPEKYADPSASPLTVEVKPGEKNEFKLELED